MVDSKILIVEDDFIVAIDLKIHLEKMGYNVLDITDNGKDALNRTKETNPDLIFMDINLKGDIDGIDTAQQIHKLYDVPIIYLTGYNDKNTIKRANITEPFGYIVKPFEDNEIKILIGMAV
jgi:two-component system, response regulator PdtaR